MALWQAAVSALPVPLCLVRFPQQERPRVVEQPGFQALANRLAANAPPVARVMVKPPEPGENAERVVTQPTPLRCLRLGVPHLLLVRVHADWGPFGQLLLQARDDVVQSLDLNIVPGERCPVTHTVGFEVTKPHLDVVSVALS